MKERNVIDINCDLGEGFGIYKICDDEKLLPYISSANIACGFHAGDPQIMRDMIKLAKKYKVAIGAHIALPDIQGFGRRKIDFSPKEITNIILYQIGALYAIAKSEEVNLQHIKPHGILYHLASEEKAVAEAIGEAVLRFDRNLWWIGFPLSWQEKVAQNLGIKFAQEGFADRNYDENNRLLPRTHPYSIINSPEQAAKHAIKIIHLFSVKTLCIHSDTPNSVKIAKRVSQYLKTKGFYIKPLNFARYI